MTRHGTTRQAALLCGIAGYADALGHLTLGGVFAANMTGNTVLLAIALLRGEWAGAVPHAMTLASFLGGLARALDAASPRAPDLEANSVVKRH